MSVQFKTGEYVIEQDKYVGVYSWFQGELGWCWTVKMARLDNAPFMLGDDDFHGGIPMRYSLQGINITEFDTAHVGDVNFGPNNCLGCYFAPAEVGESYRTWNPATVEKYIRELIEQDMKLRV